MLSLELIREGDKSTPESCQVDGSRTLVSKEKKIGWGIADLFAPETLVDHKPSRVILYTSVLQRTDAFRQKVQCAYLDRCQDNPLCRV